MINIVKKKNKISRDLLSKIAFNIKYKTLKSANSLCI